MIKAGALRKEKEKLQNKNREKNTERRRKKISKARGYRMDEKQIRQNWLKWTLKKF